MNAKTVLYGMLLFLAAFLGCWKEQITQPTQQTVLELLLQQAADVDTTAARKAFKTLQKNHPEMDVLKSATSELAVPSFAGANKVFSLTETGQFYTDLIPVLAANIIRIQGGGIGFYSNFGGDFTSTTIIALSDTTARIQKARIFPPSFRSEIGRIFVVNDKIQMVYAEQLRLRIMVGYVTQ